MSETTIEVFYADTDATFRFTFLAVEGGVALRATTPDGGTKAEVRLSPAAVKDLVEGLSRYLPMGFGDALERGVKQGRSITRKGWVDIRVYRLAIRMGDAGQHVLVRSTRYASPIPWTPQPEDLLADDWTVL